MSDRVIHAEPTAGQFIREIHCWIATYADGTEGIVAAGVKEIGVLPLMSSRRAQAESLQPMAERVQQAVADQTNYMVSVRLVTFTSTEGTRQ